MRAAISRFSLNNLLTGSGLLVIGMTVVNAGNYLFNLLLGRWLGPAAFADLSLIVTLFLVITFVTSALQTIAAKYAATYTAENTHSQLFALRTWLSGLAWRFGMVGFVLFAFGSPLWAAFFQTPNLWLFILFAIGIPFYFAQGVDRGILQGQTHFLTLAVSYQVEMWVRLALGCGLVFLGFSVVGGVVGLTISIAATWIFTYSKVMLDVDNRDTSQALSVEQRHQIIAFALPVVLGLLGQIMINNSDVLIVKRFFNPETAGSYAALALIGRIVFFATWSVVTALFPIVAQRHQRGEPHRHLLVIALGLVGGVSTILIAATVLMPDLIIRFLFSEAYTNVAPMLWLYATATALYALANVIITYQLSIGNGFGSILALIAGILQIVGLLIAHASLFEVVLVQMIILGALLFTLLMWGISLAVPVHVFRSFLWCPRSFRD